MKRTFLKQVAMAGVLAAATAVASCTMKSQEAPPLTGPSEFGTSIVVTVTPDTIFQDGASQSLITVTTRDQNGNPLRNVSLRAEIVFGGVPADFGTLSARSIVTDANGRATLVYTAPAAPAGPSVDNQTTVTVAVTPLGSDFGNSVTRVATIRLMPTGVVVPPDGLQPSFTFTPTSPTDNQSVLFSACSAPQAAPCAPANNPVATYTWSFGDASSGSGRTTTHSYSEAGTYFPTLTITDALGRSASTTQSITVAQGLLPKAAFTFSPTTPRVGTSVNFNASSSSTSAPGSEISSYTWDFGDGSPVVTTSNEIVFHAFGSAGTYKVTLVVTDSAGRKSLGTGQDVPILP